MVSVQGIISVQKSFLPILPDRHPAHVRDMRLLGTAILGSKALVTGQNRSISFFGV